MRCLFAFALLFLPFAASAQVNRGVLRGTPTRVTVSPWNPPEYSQQIADVDHLAHTSVSTFGLSGSTGDRSERVMVPDGAWITRIVLSERSNRPCSVALHWTTISNGTLYFGEEHFGCSANGRDRMYVGFVYAGDGPVAPEEPEYGALNAIRVCQRNSNDRIKGLHVGGVTLTDFTPPRVGVGSRAETQGTWSRSWPAWVRLEDYGVSQPNCNDWEAEFETCPSGEVLVGLDVQYDQKGDNVNRIEAKGLKPICGRLEVETD